jgi:hypothetical protein
MSPDLHEENDMPWIAAAGVVVGGLSLFQQAGAAKKEGEAEVRTAEQGIVDDAYERATRPMPSSNVPQGYSLE